MEYDERRFAVSRSDLSYLTEGITAGDESAYRAYRIPTAGGTAASVDSTIDTAANIVTAPNVSQFSDWTLAQPVVTTAAPASVGGRVLTADGYGIPKARVTMTNLDGGEGQIITDSFGGYRFDDVPAGAAYIFSLRRKSWGNHPLTQIQNIHSDRDDPDFIAPR